MKRLFARSVLTCCFLPAFFSPSASLAAVQGWLSWRGPQQIGVSTESNLPEKFTAQDALWTADLPGQSTAVIADGRLYIMGYRDDGPDLQEGLSCLDAVTGRLLWSQKFNDFLSDTIYLRYSTSSPTVDEETGNVYVQGTQGLLAAFTRDGQPLWLHSMMEKWGRLTFPNSRTASPLVDGDLLITRGITANWGAQGPAADRFYAFDKNSGELVWASSPGGQPKDNSFSHPYLTFLDGKRVFIAAGGDGSVVCGNARTGEPLWRVPLFRAGINSTVLVHNQDKVIAIYGTPYEPGETVALRIPHVKTSSPSTGSVVVARSEVELWKADVSTSTSSPILVGDRMYVVAEKGDLCALDVNTGAILWKLKLGIEQRNACPLYADGKLYVPILDDPAGKGTGDSGAEAGTKGALYVIKPGEKAGEILAHVELDGRCFGSPTVYDGRIYVQTTRKVYCFGPREGSGKLPAAVAVPWPKPGPAAQLQIIPSEVLLHPGESASFRARVVDAHGFVVDEVRDMKSLQWASYIPPTALVKVTMKGAFNADGKLVADASPIPSAGAFEARLGELKGYIRGRVLPALPIKQDFEIFALSETTTNNVEPPTAFAYPPLSWIGARFRFDIREKDGSKALTKTIDNKFFQRGSVFIGDPDMKNYTIVADVMSEGARRKMSEVGVINQRYVAILKGNSQEIEINSNQERIKVTKPFKWSPNTWYRLKSRVDLAPDGTGVVRAKAWKRDEPEPDGWVIEVPHRTAHRNGSPGLFGFSPQEMRVFIDNIHVTSN